MWVPDTTSVKYVSFANMKRTTKLLIAVITAVTIPNIAKFLFIFKIKFYMHQNTHGI
jgi:hypothetical protein